MSVGIAFLTMFPGGSFNWSAAANGAKEKVVTRLTLWAPFSPTPDEFLGKMRLAMKLGQ